MRWGIMGTGSVAEDFARALADVPGADLTAAGSRTGERAALFCERHSVTYSHSSYEALVGNGFVDAIYIGTPASHHHAHTLMALRAGKHVLCEKPFAVSEAQAREMFTEAHDRGLLVMEAVWPRFLPSYAKLRQLLDEEAVGDVLAVEASFGGRAAYAPKLRPFMPDLGGGALLDGAVYPISLAQMALGSFSEVRAAGQIGPSGVDEQVGLLLRTHAGQIATLMGGIRTTFAGNAVIYGSEAMIVIPGNFTNPPWIEVHRPDQPPEHYDFTPYLHRLAWQAQAFQRYVADGTLDAHLMPRQDTLEVMSVLDQARAAIGLAPVPEV